MRWQRGADPHVLIAAAARYHKDPQFLRGYGKHPARWLRAKSWLDEPAPSANGSGSGSGHQAYRNPADQNAYETEELRP